MLLKLGIRRIRSRPHHPQTCGTIESFWRNLLRECLTQTPLASFEEAKEKIGEYVEFYNFKRSHQGIGKVMPSDRYFGLEAANDGIRGMFAQDILSAKAELGSKDCLDPDQLKRESGEAPHRRAVRKAMQGWKLDEEWEEIPKGAEFVNRTKAPPITRPLLRPRSLACSKTIPPPPRTLGPGAE